MKEIQLEISERKLFERIKSESGKTAIMKESTGHPARLSTKSIMTEDDKHLFDDYVSTAIHECEIAIRHYLGECTVIHDIEQAGNGIYRLCIMIPGNFPEETVPAFEDTIFNILLNRCLQQWYILVKSDDANISTGKIQLYMKQLQEILTLRKKP